MTDYTPADLTSWPLTNLLTEYAALAVAYDRATRNAGPDAADVDLSRYEGITLVADEIERRAR